MGGGGVDGLLHGRADSMDGMTHNSSSCPLCKEVRDKYKADANGIRIHTGEAVSTFAYNIPHARFIVHTVGPYLDTNGNP